MSYDVIEQSNVGSPIELFEFSRGASAWRYTSGNETITYQGSEYAPIPIKRSAITESQDIGKSPITIETTRDNDFVVQFIKQLSSGICNLKITRYHGNDPDIIASDSPSLSDVLVFWIGRVVNVSFKGNVTNIRCESIYTSLKRTTLRRLYQVSCTHLLYGSSCSVSKASYVDIATIDAIVGAAIQSSTYSSKSDGYYTGGFVEYVGDGFIERKQIISHTSDVIVLSSPFLYVSVGDNIDTYPGCDRTLVTCKNKFSNLLNYGGFPFIPEKNPFGANSVF